MRYIEKFLKVCLTVLIISLVAFSLYRYYVLKKEEKLKEVFTKSKTNQNDYSIQLEKKSNEKKISQEDEKKEENEKKESLSSEKFVVEEKNYDNYYNQFNFDNRLVLYEGKQQSEGAKEAFDILIKDVDDPMYSKPTIAFENFNLTINEITGNNLEEYKYVLESAKNSIGNSYCTFSFEYNKLKTHVNKIIITKN